MKLSGSFFIFFVSSFLGSSGCIAKTTAKSHLRRSSQDDSDDESLKITSLIEKVTPSRVDELSKLSGKAIESMQFMNGDLEHLQTLVTSVVEELNQQDNKDETREGSSLSTLRALLDTTDSRDLGSRLTNWFSSMTSQDDGEDGQVSEDVVVRGLLYLLVLYNSIRLNRDPDFIPRNPAPVETTNAESTSAPVP